jgi:hypothetical protein
MDVEGVGGYAPVPPAAVQPQPLPAVSPPEAAATVVPEAAAPAPAPLPPPTTQEGQVGQIVDVFA